MSKTVKKLEASGHTIKVGDWGWNDRGPRRVDLSLDGFCLLVTEHKNLGMVESIAENLAFALKAPARKKRRKVDRPGIRA